MSSEPAAVREAVPPDCRLIEVRVTELRQLFNAIDPSPFRQRDLDPRAEAFIVEWSSDFPAHAPRALVVHVERGPRRADEATMVHEAIREFFGQRAASTRRQLRDLLRRGRLSLAIALAFLTLSIAIGDGLASYMAEGRLAGVLREGFLIGGWVAMWRPLEVFLYDWWPIRAEVRHFERLSTMPVRIEYAESHSIDT